MNDYSTLGRLQHQLRLAARHRGFIHVALRRLKKASSGQITRTVYEIAKSEIESDYAPKYLLGDKVQIEKDKQRELKDNKISKRTVQKYLREFEKDGLVYDTGHYVYSLTDAGHKESILAEEFGKVLFEGLAALPLSGPLEKKVLESIHRLGIYTAYILLRHSISLDMSNKGGVHGHNVDWLNGAFSPVILFNWFENIIYGSKKEIRNSRVYEQVWKIIRDNFSKEFQTFMESEKSFNAKVMDDLRADLLKKAYKHQSRPT